MISPDFIHPMIGIPFAVAALVAWFVLEVRAAVPDPDPQYGPLDVRDGLDSRTG